MDRPVSQRVERRAPRGPEAAAGPSEWTPNIVAFLCNWCSYAGADLAGTRRLQYPPHVTVIKVMCSGRVNPLFVLNALQRGADGVLISGCHPGDCHYQQGNYIARRRITLLRRLLEHIGVDPRRVQMSWVSAAEGGKFAEVIRDVTEEIRSLGPMGQFRRERATAGAESEA